MEKRLKIFVGIFVLLVMISFVSASDTLIKMKTKPHHEVQIVAFEPDAVSFTQLGKCIETSDRWGDVNCTLDLNKDFNLRIFVKKDGENIMPFEDFNEEYPAGEDIYLEMAPSGFELIDTPVPEGEVVEVETNDTEGTNETEEILIEDTEPDESSGLAGFVVFDVLRSKATLYSIIGIIVLIVLIFGGKMLKRRFSGPREIRIKKLSEMQADKEEKIDDFKDVIEDAERKIKEAQEEINKLKNDDKIKQAKKKIMEDEKELIRLRAGRE